MAKAPSKPTSKSAPKPKASSKAGKIPKPVKAVASKKASPSETVKLAAAKKLTHTKTVRTAPKAAKVSLQARLDDVAKRLISADTKTQKNITALETDFSALAQQMGRTKAGQTRLTRRVTDLSNTLTADFQAMQDDIRKGLAQALQSPTIESLQDALTHAESRLSESESAQVTAIARINHHIADIAKIVEERLSDEAQARNAAMAEMKQAMNNGQSQVLAAQAALEKTHNIQSQAMQLRVANLQNESADAIRSLGDKLVDVAEEMGRRRETMASKLRQDLNESTLSSSAEFEQFRRVVERRLEALEAEVQDIDGQIDRATAPLTSRMEGLEYGLIQAPEQPHYDYAPSLQAVPPMTSAVVPSVVQGGSPLAAPVNQFETAPEAPSVQSAYPVVDAFSPVPTPIAAVLQQQSVHTQPAPLDLNEPAAAQAIPYDPQAYQSSHYPPAQAANTQMAQVQMEQAHIPDVQAAPHYAQEVPPAGYAPNPYGDASYAQNSYEEPAPLQAPSAQSVVAPQGYEAPQGYVTPPPYAPQPPFPAAEDLPIIDGDLPYADPAYAETPNNAASYSDDSMGTARPGAFDNFKKVGRKTSKPDSAGAPGLSAFMTPRNLKLGGLVAALGLASFIGLQTLVKNDVPTSGEFSVASNAALDESRPSLNQMEGPAGQILSPNQRAGRSMMTAEGSPAAPNIDQEVIGDYADNRKMALAAGGETALGAAAKAGNPIAQLQLGLSQIESGNLDAGVTNIRAAANQDQPAALYRLAKLYETGQGVGIDAKTARQLTERAARGGNRIAMHDLALYFAEGRGGIKIDMPTAAKWFEKAAERGVVDSQFNLGVLFESGQGLPQDMESALMWYSVAGTQGDQMAAGRVVVLRKTLTEDQVERADKRITAFTPTRIDEQANGIFKNVPWAKPSKVADNNLEKAGIIKTQNLLNEIGYAVGSADGAIGPKTKNAILNFQRTNGLSETGVVSAELIERLEIATGA